MELYQLKSFLVIAKRRNLTKAAECLHLSPSALSSQIKALEEELRVTLFHRTTRGMELTEAGDMLLAHAHEVLEASERLRQKAMALNREGSEAVTIGLNADPAFLRVGPVSRRLSLLHPDIDVIFLPSQSVDTPQMLRQGHMDLAFVYGDVAGDDLEEAPLAHVNICLVIPSVLLPGEKKLTWPQVAALPWIWVANNCPFYHLLMENLERHDVLPNKAVTTVDEQIVRELVVEGQGVALMREDEAVPLARKGQVHIWEKGWMTIPLRLVWLKENRRKKRIQASRDAILHIWKPEESESGDGHAGKFWM